jgi:transposase
VQSLPLDEIKHRIGKNPQSFTYWLRHYLEHHLADIARHVDKAARSRKQR